MTAKTTNAFALIVVIGFISIPLIFYYVSHDFIERCDDNQTTPKTAIIPQNNSSSSSISNSGSWSKEEGIKSNKSKNVSEVSIRVPLFNLVKCSKEIKHFIEQNLNVSRVSKINTLLQNDYELRRDGGLLAAKLNNETVIVALSYFKGKNTLEMLNKNGESLKSISLDMLNINPSHSSPQIVIKDQTVVVYYRSTIFKYAISSSELIKLQPMKESLKYIIIDAKTDPITKKTYVLDNYNTVYLTNYEDDALEVHIKLNRENGKAFSMAVYNNTYYYLRRDNLDSIIYFQSNVLNSEIKIGYVCRFHQNNRINVYKPGFLILSCYFENLIKIYTLGGHFVMNFLNRSSDAEKPVNFYFDTDFYLMTSNDIEIYEFYRNK